MFVFIQDLTTPSKWGTLTISRSNGIILVYIRALPRPALLRSTEWGKNFFCKFLLKLPMEFLKLCRPDLLFNKTMFTIVPFTLML